MRAFAPPDIPGNAAISGERQYGCGVIRCRADDPADKRALTIYAGQQAAGFAI
ncbi:hypothetical protein QNH14_03750 [Apirhabdus apintestini]|uniref:hypothetical protein n=1 Tax=Erwinia sp. HR93 TaxID=3094840 RepID=UPI002ADEBA2C|nr:hypothetical protein [Erwinia sp. HR93]MEA1063612.1 hypothetical protein [Erwinia sp. HR93]WPM85376.1 hypothetical protein QNH14_03750 [Enterobacteriaceae bacterium CA-0114]